MAVRVSPYLLSLIDWTRPYEDPLRIQFIPLASRLLPDHPKLGLDSLHERADMPVPGPDPPLPDKALFLALDTCPVYCRFCTRSYAVGIDTEEVEKFQLRATEERWEQRLRLHRAAGPSSRTSSSPAATPTSSAPDQITLIGETLLAMPNIRRMRFATKGPAVMPQKILTDDAWLDALTRVVEQGRKLHKEVVLHTHFNHPNEITAITRAAMNRLFERGITVRNQTVLQRGVNDTRRDDEAAGQAARPRQRPPVLRLRARPGEGRRGPAHHAADRARHREARARRRPPASTRPTFVVDAPGGGGKRDAHSFEHYDRDDRHLGVHGARRCTPASVYLYFDPIDTLPAASRARWADPAEQAAMVEAALQAAAAGRRG